MFTSYGFCQFLLKNYDVNTHHLIYNNIELGNFELQKTNQLLLDKKIKNKIWTEQLGDVYMSDIRRYMCCNTDTIFYVFENGSVSYNELPNIIIENNEQYYRPPEENNKEDLGGLGYQKALYSFQTQINALWVNSDNN